MYSKRQSQAHMFSGPADHFTGYSLCLKKLIDPLKKAIKMSVVSSVYISPNMLVNLILGKMYDRKLNFNYQFEF